MINKVILVGRVGTDPEVQVTRAGVKTARLRLATTERYGENRFGERKEVTEWHTITLWRGLAEVAERYVEKGSLLYIEGRLRTREWIDEHQVKHYTTEISADVMQMLSSKQSPAMKALSQMEEALGMVQDES